MQCKQRWKRRYKKDVPLELFEILFFASRTLALQLLNYFISTVRVRPQPSPFSVTYKALYLYPDFTFVVVTSGTRVN